MNARPSCPLAASAGLRLLFLAAACLTTPLIHAQSRCTPADLDISFRFGAYAPSSYIVVMLARNVTSNVCLLDTNLRPAFYALSEPNPLDIRVIPDSDHPQPLLLDPSFTAHQTIRWQTTQAAGAPSCIKASVMNLPVNGDTSRPAQIVSPSLLQPICSQVAFATYAIGPTFGDDDSEASAPSEPELTVTSGLPTYHPGESFILHAQAALPNAQPPGPGAISTPTRSVAFFSPFGCPHFLVRQRAFDGSTRLEEYSGSRVRCSRQFPAGLTPILNANFDAVPPVQGNALGETSVQLMELTGPLDAPRVALAQSNPITLHVTSANVTTPSTPIEELPPYDGWKTAFTVTDTSFGKRSGLLDQSTHLEWLRLSATRNKSQEEIRRAMYPHKAFDGWRYATADEVAMFFRHFTGTLSGRTTDAAVVVELQRLMGGPFEVKNTPGHSSRSITYGRIAGYYPYTSPDDGFVPASAPRLKYYFAEISLRNDDGQIAALADPHRIGGIDGDRNSNDTGTFLVREH